MAEGSTFFGSYRPPPDTSAQSLSSASLVFSIGGALTSAVGGFYAAKSQQNAFKSAALSAEFEQSMSQINARAAEVEAQEIMEAGEREIGNLTARAGQAKGARRASVGASGTVGGIGSASEVEASAELAKQQDVYTINSNRVRAANASRTGAVNYRNQGLLSGVSAMNLRRTARSISPESAAATSLLGSASGVSESWYRRSRRGY